MVLVHVICQDWSVVLRLWMGDSIVRNWILSVVLRAVLGVETISKVESTNTYYLVVQMVSVSHLLRIWVDKDPW